MSLSYGNCSITRRGFGIHYSDFWGPRGFTHSFLFAAVIAGLMVLLFRHTVGITRLSLFLYLFMATASHGLLDSMTNGGLGVAFFSPFDNRRYFFPWRPIRVSPVALSRFFSPRMVEIVKTELVWIWLPSIVLAPLMISLRWRTAGRRKTVEVAGAGNRT